MLSYRVIRKLQADLLLVEMTHTQSTFSSSPIQNHNRSDGSGAGNAKNDSLGDGSQVHPDEEKLLRIIPLPEKLISLPESELQGQPLVPGSQGMNEAFTPRGLSLYELIPRPKERLLKELVAFRSVAARKPSSFVSLEHVSLQQPPAAGQVASPKNFMAPSPTGSAQPPAQLHLFQGTSSICGQGRFSLKFARPYLCDENLSGSADEILWRLLSELASALHIFHFTLRDTETTENVEGKSFFTYYGQLLDANVYVAFRDASGDLRTAQEMATVLQQRADEGGYSYGGPVGSGLSGEVSLNTSIQDGNRAGGGARKHFPAWELQVAVDLPTSILYRAVPKNAKEERRHSYQWAAEDIRAAAEIVLSCMEVKSELHSSPTASDAANKNRYSQELRFLLSKMTAPDPRQRPTAAQIINFQAVALRRRTWKLQAINQELQWTNDSLRRQLSIVQEDNSKLTEQLSKQRSNLPSGVSPGSPRIAFKPQDDESIQERERLVAEREKKIAVFLHLYNLTANQLDAMPAAVDPAQVQSYQHHLSSNSPSASRVRQDEGARRSTESSKHSPFANGEQRQGSGGQPIRRSGSYTPPPHEYFDQHGLNHQTPERDEANRGRMPDSPELSPLPKASDYGSEVDDSGAYGGGGGGGGRPGSGAAISADGRERLGESKRSSQARASQAFNFFDLVDAPAPAAGMSGETGYGRSSGGGNRESSSPQSRDAGSEQRRETTPGSNAMRRPLPFTHAQTGPVHVPLEDARMVLEHRSSPVAPMEIGECEIIELDEGDSPTERNIFPSRDGSSAVRNSLRPGTQVYVEEHRVGHVDTSSSYRGREELPSSSAARANHQQGAGRVKEEVRPSDLGPTPSRTSLLQQQRALNRLQHGIPNPQPATYRDATLLPGSQLPYSTPVKADDGASDDPLQGTPNTARGSSAPPSERKGRSPSSTKDRTENQKWMTSLLNDLESMRKELHDASSASVPSVVGGAGANPGPVAASMLQLVSQDAESGAALTELRSRVPKSQLQPLSAASPPQSARPGLYPQSTANLGLSLQGHSVAAATKPQTQSQVPTVLPAIQGSAGKRFFATPGIPSASGSSSPRGHLKPNYQPTTGTVQRSKLP